MARARGTVTGDKQIIANIRRASNSIGGSFLDRAMKAALEPMRQQTQLNARPLRDYAGKYPAWPNPVVPRPGGHLDEGVVIAKRSGRGQFRRVFWVSFTKRSRKLAHLVELGTAPHFQPNLGIHHPGSAPRPFMRPAFESRKTETVNDLGKAVWLRMSGSLIGASRGRPRSR